MSSEKVIILWSSLIFVLSDSWIMCSVFRLYQKWTFFIKLPFLGSASFQIRKKLRKLFTEKSTSCNVKIIFTSPIRVKSFFTFKDKLPNRLRWGYLYKYKCGDCNATYYGKTKRHFKIRIYEHLDISFQKGEDWQKSANSDSKEPLILQVLSISWRKRHQKLMTLRLK